MGIPICSSWKIQTNRTIDFWIIKILISFYRIIERQFIWFSQKCIHKLCVNNVLKDCSIDFFCFLIYFFVIHLWVNFGCKEYLDLLKNKSSNFLFLIHIRTKHLPKFSAMSLWFFMKMVQIIVCAGCTFPRASPNLILRFPSFICVIGNTRPLLLLVLSFPSPDPVLKFLGEKNQDINFISTYYSFNISTNVLPTTYLCISRGQK